MASDCEAPLGDKAHRGRRCAVPYSSHWLRVRAATFSKFGQPRMPRGLPQQSADDAEQESVSPPARGIDVITKTPSWCMPFFVSTAAEARFLNCQGLTTDGRGNCECPIGDHDR